MKVVSLATVAEVAVVILMIMVMVITTELEMTFSEFLELIRTPKMT